MTDRELCIKLLNNMIEWGYNMFGETPEHMVDRLGPDTRMWQNFYNNFMLSKAGA